MKTLKFILGFALLINFSNYLNAQRHDRDGEYHHRNHRNEYRHDRWHGVSGNHSGIVVISHRSYSGASVSDLEYMIERAKDSRELTPKELRKLECELDDLKRLEDKIYRNHRVTYWERNKLKNAKNRLGEMIYSYTHNRRTC